MIFIKCFGRRGYEKNRLQVYRFLIDAAGDGMVAPTILPGSQKLGEERSSLYLEAVEGEGVLMDEYRSRKLLDRYLEPVASQFDLTFPEIRLLLYLSHLKQPVSRRELSDYTNMSRRSLALYLQNWRHGIYPHPGEQKKKRHRIADSPSGCCRKQRRWKKRLPTYSGSMTRHAIRISARTNCCSMRI